ncbi:MAG: sugar phosphate isomerase/epimerase [Gammaproteobacteria bacterium]|nr:sugar phosphate isomerase/epimerase [Gammaproteobacteria bacterium]
MSTAPDLIATYWTIAGQVQPLAAPELEASPLDFRARVAAAQRAGYRGIGLMHSDLMNVRRKVDFATMRSILADHDMQHVELEFLVGWLDDDAAYKAVLKDLCVAAEALGARHLKAGPDMQGKAWPLEHMAARFRALCGRAREAGTDVALEIMPWSNLRSIDDGLAVVTAADAANGGLLLDIWHLARGGVPYADIAKVPAQLLKHVELDDADAEVVGTLLEDTLDRRRLCGEGALDVAAFVRAVQATGYDGPYGVEIISTAHRQLGLDEAARVSFDTASAQFAC